MRNIQQNIIVRFSHYSLRLEFLSCSSTGILILLAVSVVSAENIYTENPDTYLVKLKVLQSCEHMLRLPGKYKSDLPIISCVVKQKFPDWKTVHMPYLSPTLMYSSGIGRYPVLDSMINTGFTETFSSRMHTLQSKQP